MQTWQSSIRQKPGFAILFFFLAAVQLSTTNLRNDTQPKAKSLFRNILAASPYGSIFYEDSESILTMQVVKNQYFSE